MRFVAKKTARLWVINAVCTSLYNRAVSSPESISRVIQTVGLSKLFGQFPAVEELSLEVNRGEVFGFLGPNGAGKTTTIKMLMGMRAPSSGKADIGGMDCFADRVAVKRVVGYLPDVPVFYDYLRGREILRFMGQMHGIERDELERRQTKLMERLGLTEAAEEYAINYSMGMKKKLGLACALVHDPPVLILDEPTNGLDPRASRQIQELITESAAGGRTIFLSTHLLDMAEKLCHRVGIIDRGKLAAVGTREELAGKLAPGGTLEEVFFKVTEEEVAE
ncbi:MAG TPA: ABC transporter ATP-binding protein [Tepidisphaeraceae bacterium]|jgi:ABC-2 type transport system ATP-binding protein|nr:ABC transporter ATP-binding protein [Tepidisphaeraceae bacterium]